MSDTVNQGDAGASSVPAPGLPEPAKLRRGVFGYKRTDVDQALESRDAQLSELRQDVTALWLAFAQHDRMLRGALDTELGEAFASVPPPRDDPEPMAAEPEPSPEAIVATERTESIDRQLTDLDEVLAAIEMATQALERTYADEIAADADAGDGNRTDAEPLEVERSESDAKRPLEG